MANEEQDPLEPVAERTGPLTRYRVIDIGNLLAGPLVGTILADYGADVVKVEDPKRGDALRSYGWRDEDDDSLWWRVIGRNKRPVRVDLRTDHGQEVVRTLSPSADVLIEGFRPGVMEGWNLGPEHLLALNPKLVYVRISGFGQSGPYSRRPGFGTLAEAMSGFASLNGFPDRPPALPPFGLADGIAAVSAVAGTVMALLERDTISGLGQVIDVSLYEPMHALLGPQAAVFDRLGIEQRRSGNQTPFSAPRGAYLTQDGVWIALSASTQAVALRVLELLGVPRLHQGSKFSTPEGRVTYVDELDELIGRWFAAKHADEALALLHAHSVPAIRVYDMAAYTSDPHVIERDSLVDLVDEQGRRVLVPGPLARLSRTPGAMRYPGMRGHVTKEEIAESWGDNGTDGQSS